VIKAEEKKSWRKSRNEKHKLSDKG